MKRSIEFAIIGVAVLVVIMILVYVFGNHETRQFDSEVVAVNTLANQKESEELVEPTGDKVIIYGEFEDNTFDFWSLRNVSIDKVN